MLCRLPFYAPLSMLLVIGCNDKDQGEDDTNEPAACMPADYPLSTAQVTMTGTGGSDHIGDQLTSPADLNGDMVPDLAVAASTADDAGDFSGKVHVLYSPFVDGTSMSEADATITGKAAYDYLGAVLETGDLNGDGYGDIVLGARGNDAAATDAGAVYVFIGPITGQLSASDAEIIMSGGTEQANMGSGVAINGDYTADGNGDLVVGQPSPGDSLYELVYFFRSPLAPGVLRGEDADGIAYPEREGDGAGDIITSPGDMNGDGDSEVLIGAGEFYANGAAVGKIYSVSDPLEYEDDIVFLELVTGAVVGTSANERPGVDLQPAGDLNGDGYQDVLIGVDYNASGAGSQEGKAIIVYGPMNTTFSVSEAAVSLVGAPGDQAGAEVAALGDVDGDAVSDVLIGAPGSGAAGSDSGAAYLVYGPFDGAISLASDSDVTFTGTANSAAGADVAAAGDQNGDGFADMFIGVPGDRGGAGTGQVSLVMGCVR